MPELSTIQAGLLNDGIRYIHLLAVIIGLGTSFLADLSVLRGMKSPLSSGFLRRLERQHRIVSLALLAMWISGAALIYLRTGFVWDNFSPKLIAKIVVVSVLTLNSFLISRYAMPKLAQNASLALIDFPMRIKLPFALIAGASTTSWLLALALGSSTVLKTAGAQVQIALLSGSYLAGCIFALTAVLIVRPAVKAAVAR